MNLILTIVVMHATVLTGYSGAVLILGGYILSRTRTVQIYGKVYDVINIVGSVFLVLYAVTLHSVPFAILNGIWMITATVGLLSGVRSRGASGSDAS
jgi:hypothetical protein